MRNPADRTVFWMLIFVGYAAAAAAIRLAHVETLTGDDAESFLWSRTLDWGYGAQPPLYAWLHWAVNRVLGETVAASVAVRAVCLAGVSAGAFALARRFAPVRIAGPAALGVFLVPEIAQTFLRTRTHNILATALAPLIVLAFLRLVDRGRAADHALFGLAVALGILAKATVAVVPLALVLAALTDRGTGAALRTPRVLWAVGVMALVLAGPAAWLWANTGVGTASLSKFEATGDRLQGIARFLRSMADSWGIVALLAGLAVLATRGTRPAGREARLVWRAGGIAVLLIVAGLLTAGAAEVKERWLVPILVPLVPVTLAVLMQRRGWARFAPSVLGGAYGLAMLAALPAYHRDRPRPPMAPFAALAEEVRAIPADLILAPGDIAANLWIARPGLPLRQRVAGEGPPCRGRVMLLAHAEQPLEAASFADALAPCTATPGEVRRIAPPGGPAFHLVVLTLAPPG